MAERLKHLKTLGLSSTASEDDIKKAYKKLALQFHPDKNDSEDANAKFQEISNAYQCLVEGVRGRPNLEEDDIRPALSTHMSTKLETGDGEKFRTEFFRHMFQEMFVPPFFFHGPGAFFFHHDVYDDDDDDDDYYYYYSDSNDDDCRPGANSNSYSKEESNRYKFNYTNTKAGPEMSAKQLRKREKRKKQRARQREKKATKGSAPKPAAYSDDINESKGEKSESNQNLRHPNQFKTFTDKQENTGVKAGAGTTQNPEAKFNPERPSTPVRNDQQRANKSTKKKMESDQRKREREMEEIAAELRRQQEEKQEKQRRKEEQERLQKEKEKTSSTHFEPFTEFYDADSKSRRKRRGKKREEEEEKPVQPDEPQESCTLPTDSYNKLYMDPEPNHPKTSPYGPIGSKIPSSSKTQFTNGHSQGEYGKGQGYMGSGFGQAEVPGACCGQQGHAYTGFSQSQTRQQTYNKQPTVTMHKEPRTSASQTPKTQFSQFNQFDVLDVSDEDSNFPLEDQGGLSSNRHMGQSKTFPEHTYHQQQQQNPYTNSYSTKSAEPSRNSPFRQEHKPPTQSHQYGHTTPDPNRKPGFSRNSGPSRNVGPNGNSDPSRNVGPYGNSDPSRNVGPYGDTNPSRNVGPYGNSNPSRNVGPYGNSDPSRNVGPYGNSDSSRNVGPYGNSDPSRNVGPYGNSDPSRNVGPYGDTNPSRNVRNHYDKEYKAAYLDLDDIDESGFVNTATRSSPDTFIKQEYKNGTNNSKERGTNGRYTNGNQQTTFNKSADKENSSAHGRQNFAKQQHFSKPFSSNIIRPTSPMFGGVSAPPTSGYTKPSQGQTPPHTGVGSQTPGQRDFDNRNQYQNNYHRPPGFAMNGASPRPKAFSDSGYHAIGRTGNKPYQNAQTTGEQSSSYDSNRKTAGISHLNGVREGPNIKREGTLPKTNHNSGVDSLPSRQCYASPSVSKDSPVLSSSRNNMGSLDSLDDFPTEPQTTKNSQHNRYDMSHLETRFEGLVGREELGVPKAMFSDNIKNYYR